MKSPEEGGFGSPEYEPTSLIQHIQLVSEKTDKKIGRWQKLAGIISRVIRSRFGLRSAELANRFAEAKVAEVEGQAMIRRAEAIERLGRASVDFARAKQMNRESGNSLTDVVEFPNAAPGQARIAAAMQELKVALADMEKQGATVEIHVADAKSELPKAPDG